MRSFLLSAMGILAMAVRGLAGAVGSDITPIPMEYLNPRLTEFRRIDANSDNQLTFSEFLLSDRPFIESTSRYFHELDANSDGRVTRDEFEAYYKSRDEEHHRQRAQNDQFFKQLALSPFDLSSIGRHDFGFPPGIASTSHNQPPAQKTKSQQQPQQQQRNPQQQQ